MASGDDPTNGTAAISHTSMKVPKDQGLVLTIFYSVSLAVILMVWLFLPPIISHEDEDKPKVKILKPEEAIEKADEVLTQAETSLAELEKAKTEKAKPQKAKTGSAKGNLQALPKADAGSGSGGKPSASQSTPDKKASKSGDKQ